MMKTSVLLLFLISTLSETFAENDQTVNVQIKSGLIEGQKQSFDGKDLDVFLGIPYAQPPVGTLRFKRPLPVNGWSGSFDAKHWPSSCMHHKLHQDYFNENMSEDCLYLNIWSPNDENSVNSLKPVFFWIHGGGLTSGSSVEKFYSGHVLAAKGNIVVVTINYRLNIFGFLYTGTDDAPGNMGLWDQALALEWVNDNIQYFGGDPSRITIAGESAGSFSTSIHILSPITRHLFKNAILMSGAASTKQGVCSEENLIKHYKQYLETTDSSPLFSPELIEYIKNKPAELFEFPTIGMGSDCMCPILLDGHFLPENPMKMLKDSDFKKNFNLLLGSTEDEGSLFFPIGVTGAPFDKHTPPRYDYNEAIAMFENVLKALIPDIGDDANKVSRLYFRGLSNRTESDTLLRTAGIALGDFALGCPTILFGKKLYEKDPKMNVFQYYFNSKTNSDKLFCAKWMGVCHFDDIYPLFGVPFAEYDKYEEKEREVSEEMIEIFSSFVKTGRPSEQSSAKWHKFYKIDDKVVAPFYEITDKPRAETNFGVGLKITECEYIWKKYFAPEL